MKTMFSLLLVSSLVACAQMKPMVPKLLNDFSDREVFQSRVRVKSVTAAYATANGIYLKLKARLGDERFYRKHTMVIRPDALPGMNKDQLSIVHELPSGNIMRGWTLAERLAETQPEVPLSHHKLRSDQALPLSALQLSANQNRKLVSVQSAGAGGWILLLVTKDGKKTSATAMTLPSVTKQRKRTLDRLRTPIMVVTRVTQVGVFFLSGGMADPGGIHDLK